MGANALSTLYVAALGAALPLINYISTLTYHWLLLAQDFYPIVWGVSVEDNLGV